MTDHLTARARPPSARPPLLSAAALVALALGCGARTSLPVGDRGAGGGGGAEPQPCEGGEVRACGTDVGACVPGLERCEEGLFGACEGAVVPAGEICNGVDDDCDGPIDEDFHVGEACDGPDSDLCADDVMSCAGCSAGRDDIEVCNGADDDCNGVVDADCQVGSCKPTLLVTGSTPSSPTCIDFPVGAGSTGVIEYPCAGGPVTAELGAVSFSGSVTGGVVSLDGTVIIPGAESPDGCTWQTSHHIGGSIAAAALTYSYSEVAIAAPPGVDCWEPCTEIGTVAVQWIAGP